MVLGRRHGVGDRPRIACVFESVEYHDVGEKHKGLGPPVPEESEGARRLIARNPFALQRRGAKLRAFSTPPRGGLASLGLTSLHAEGGPRWGQGV